MPPDVDWGAELRREVTVLMPRDGVVASRVSAPETLSSPSIRFRIACPRMDLDFATRFVAKTRCECQ